MDKVTALNGTMTYEPPLNKAVRLINELLELDHETITLLNWHHSETVTKLTDKLATRK